MSQLHISDKLAATIHAAAGRRDTTAEQFLQNLLFEIEDGDALADRLLTSAAQKRMVQGAAEVEQGRFVTQEEVNHKFESLFRELQSR